MHKILCLAFQGLPPTTNTMYRNAGHRRYKRQEVADWQEKISALLSSRWCNKSPHPGRVAVTINFTAHGRKHWDIDNRLKALIDCLVMGGIIIDDSQIDGLHVTRETGTETKTQIILHGV